jgi:hypothetical protein
LGERESVYKNINKYERKREKYFHNLRENFGLKIRVFCYLILHHQFHFFTFTP